MPSKLPQTVQEIDGFIRSGQAPLARQRLAALQKARIPRALAITVAALARRTGLSGFSIRLLNPIVRPSAKSSVRATDAEKAEYAAALIRIGAAVEAREILGTIDVHKHPETLLYQSFALVSQWDYRATIPLLSAYVAEASLTDYQRLVGKVNLAAAYVYERQFTEAAITLRELLEETQEKQFHLLRGNALELAAQQAILRRHWREAAQHLREAGDALRDTGGLDRFFVDKWKAIFSVLRQDGDAVSLRELGRVRTQSQARQHWETVRDCDLYQAIGAQDEKLLLHVYFGTPFQSFRARIFSEFGRPVELPAAYEWNLGPRREGASAPLLDLQAPLAEGSPKSGYLLHRLLVVLSSDFYRPFRLPSLHALLYPGEYFNPISSPTRVHQIIKRVKQWLQQSRMPIAVREKNGSYRLESNTPCRLRIAIASVPPDAHGVRLQRLREGFPGGGFTTVEAAGWLKLPPRTVSRALSRGEKQGELERRGKGTATRYGFTSLGDFQQTAVAKVARVPKKIRQVK